jgi:hypothetical protein
MSYESARGMGQSVAAAGSVLTSGSTPPTLPKLPPTLSMAQATPKTISSLFSTLRAPVPAIPRGNVATVPSERIALKTWFIRYFGAGSAAYKEKLEKDPNFTYCSPNILGKFRTARTRIVRLLRQGTLAASQGAPFAAFMQWWRGCERDGYAAWDPQVVPGIRAGAMPRAAYSWWSGRYRHAAGTTPITTIGQVGREVDLQRRAALLAAGKATPISPMQVVAPVRSTVPSFAPAGLVAPTATAHQSVPDPGMRLAMNGLGQTWTEMVGVIGSSTARPVPVNVACPSSSVKNTLFGFTMVSIPSLPAPPRPTSAPLPMAPRPRVMPVAEATAAALERARAEMMRRRQLEQLEEQVAALQAQLSAATSAGSSEQMASLQAQIESLTASLASAQHDHAAAATAAAAAHRDEVASLQAQIGALNDAMAASTNNSEVAGLRAQVEALLGQLAAAEVAADESTEAAADSEAAYQATASWFERNKTNLLIGWKVWSGRKAMALPAPTTTASPSGLARNPGRRKGYYRKGYSYMRGGKRVRVPGCYIGR